MIASAVRASTCRSSQARNESSTGASAGSVTTVSGTPSSAAVAFDSHVIGVVLTGMLHDGTAGASTLSDSPEPVSQRDRDILEFERQWWKYAGAKETAVREKFDMSSTRYYQVLNALIDRPEALESDPLLVRRLRRLRSERQRQRSARRLGFEV